MALSLLVLGLASGPTQALRVCFLDRDLPRADRATSSGFDYELMAEVATTVGQDLESVWSSSRSAFSEIEDSDLPLARLARGECDAVASVPGREALGRWESELSLSDPYYGAGFELVVGDGAPIVPGSLDDLTGLRVGVRLQSLAHSLLAARGVDWRASPTVDASVGQLRRGEVDAIVAWGPALTGTGLGPVAGYEPPRALRWNEHVAVRDPKLADTVNEVIRRWAAGGRLAELAARYQFPYHAPFVSTSDRSAVREFRSGRVAAGP